MLVLSHVVVTDKHNGVVFIDPSLKLTLRQQENRIIEKLAVENKELKIMNGYLRNEVKSAKRLLSKG